MVNIIQPLVQLPVKNVLRELLRTLERPDATAQLIRVYSTTNVSHAKVMDTRSVMTELAHALRATHRTPLLVPAARAAQLHP